MDNEEESVPRAVAMGLNRQWAKLRTQFAMNQSTRTMQRITLFLTLLLFTSLVTHGQNQEMDKLLGCQRDWKYKDLKKPFSGTVVFYNQPVVMCGGLSTASVALLRTDNDDTVRVLTLCNVKKDFNALPTFAVGEKVTVMPTEKPHFRVNLMPVDFTSCRLKIAYFGIIEKAE